MRQCVRDDFSILLPAAEAIKVLGGKFKLSHIAAVPQEHPQPRLILNLSVNPKEGILSVNDTTERDVAPESMKFGHALPRILQAIWEADLDQGSVRVSKLDMKNAYH